jgi:hypothetical protein
MDTGESCPYLRTSFLDSGFVCVHAPCGDASPEPLAQRGAFGFLIPGRWCPLNGLPVNGLPGGGVEPPDRGDRSEVVSMLERLDADVVRSRGAAHAALEAAEDTRKTVERILAKFASMDAASSSGAGTEGSDG